MAEPMTAPVISTTGTPKASITAIGRRELGGGEERDLFNRDDYELSNPITNIHAVIELRVQIYQCHFELTSVTSVDETG